jgi:hypothetical protein
LPIAASPLSKPGHELGVRVLVAAVRRSQSFKPAAEWAKPPSGARQKKVENHPRSL